METGHEGSLLEKYADVKYHVDVFDLLDREDRDRLAALMARARSEDGMVMAFRKDYGFEKQGRILAHVEWFTYRLEKVSPYMGTIVNPGEVPL